MQKIARLSKRPGIVSVALLGLLLLVLVTTVFQASTRNLDAQLSGPMARHRDAIAIAISKVQYGHWDGYSSLRAVNRTLVESGMSLRSQDWANAGAKDYFDLMRQPPLVNAALEKAKNIKAPHAEGLFFMQDEKGMAPLYIFSFKLFGIAADSLFKGYMVLVAASLTIAAITFWRIPWAMFLFLSWSCVHLAMLLILGSQIGVDVNLVQGDRFSGILALVPTLHLTLLLLLKVPPTRYVIWGALLQGTVLTALFLARITTLWQAIAILALAVIVLTGTVLRRDGELLQRLRSALRQVWPAAIVLLSCAGLILHQKTVINPEFAKIQQEHPIWHNIVTVLHNNPARSLAPHNIPQGIPVWDDQVSYLLFEREIKDRGESNQHYLRNDKDWYFRTSEPRWDYLWGKYDQVLRDIFIKTISDSPAYSFKSVFWYQPGTVVRLALSDRFIKPGFLLYPVVIVPLLIGIALLAVVPYALPAGTLPALFVLGAFSFSPVLLAAASELRVAEPFAVIILIIFAIVGLFSAKAINTQRAGKVNFSGNS